VPAGELIHAAARISRRPGQLKMATPLARGVMRRTHMPAERRNA
jgi:hypothetical protein